MSKEPSIIRQLWDDLERRHVVRVAIGYIIVAWGLVEGSDVVLPTFGAPDWVFRAIIAAAFLGFPITIILAWVFDISARQRNIVENDKVAALLEATPQGETEIF